MIRHAARWSRRFSIVFVLTLGVALTAPGTAAPVHAAPGESQVPAANPDLVRACGIDIHVVLDESGSVRNFKSDVQTAFRAFTGALKNTGSRLAVSEFSTVARLPLAGAAQDTYTVVTDATIASTFEPYIATGYNPDGTTNWEDGFRLARYQLPRPSQVQPHLVVFITDGNPNRVIREDRVTYDPGNPSQTANEYENKVPLSSSEIQRASERVSSNRAVANSNGVKAAGSHVLTIAVGDGLSGSATLGRLIDISGPDVFDGTGTFDISTTDVYKETDFSQLEVALREAAFQLCAPSVTVRKLVDLTPDNGVADAVPGPGFDLTAAVSPTPSRWVLPPGATGSTATTTTDANGFANFQWDTAAPTGSSVTVTEVDPSTVVPGLVFDPSLTSCTFRTPDQPQDTPLATTTVPLGFSADVPADAIVTCTIYNVVPPAPAVDIEKATNGVDADTAPGPSIPAGNPVDWTYVVTNTGNVTLDAVTVADDRLGPITCPVSTLAPAASTTCSASGVAVAGAYVNTSTVTAQPSTGGSTVTDSDPSNYTGTVPGIDIEKATNGDDADLAPGPFIEVGNAVDWTYVVTNTGTAPLTGVTVVDDPPVAVTCPMTTLTVGASMTCTAGAAAVPGQFENSATATGMAGATQVSDTDPSHYFGAAPAIQVEKSTNLQDADTPTGPLVGVGSGVLWVYLVQNTGNVVLPTFTVSDSDPAVNVSCPRPSLLPGDVVVCVALGTAQTGQYTNTATATGTDPNGTVVNDTDPSHYFGVDSSIDLEKRTNGEDADNPTGPFLTPGAAVTWTYTVTNTGNSALTGLTIVDNVEGAVSCPQSTLAPLEQIVCTRTATGGAATGQYANSARAEATDPLGVMVSDADPSHYFGADPGISVEKRTNGVDADVAPGPFIRTGGVVDWVYTVTNTGNETLTDVSLADSDLGVVTCPKTTLVPQESMDCEVIGTSVGGLYMNTASVSGRPVAGPDVTDTDPSHYTGYSAGVDIEKATNGQDADTPTGPEIDVGQPVQWTYVVTNTGSVPIVSYTVTDSDPGVSVSCPTSAPIAPGASVTCTASGVAVAGQYANNATVTAFDNFEDELTDADPSHYFGRTPPPTTTTTTPAPPTTAPPSTASPPVIPTTPPPATTTTVAPGGLPATGAAPTSNGAIATVLTALGVVVLLAARRSRTS